MTNHFWVADLDAKGELNLKEEYAYDSLQNVGFANVLIAEFATFLWSDPDGFDVQIPGVPTLSLRWRPSAETAGIATLWCRGRLASLSLLATGLDRQTDTLTLEAFQHHLVRELHDTGYEPAFDLMGIPERPLVASVHLHTPDHPAERAAFALADRCFAAAYFRYHRLA